MEEQARLKDLLYTRLPDKIRKTTLGTKELENPNIFITNFMKSNLPSSDGKVMNNELKKDFVLVKYKPKLNQDHPPRKGKNYVSRTERKDLGLYKLNRNSSKFLSFRPMHKMWKQYFRTVLNIQELERRGFTGESQDVQWPGLARTLLKADYHGAFVRVTRSRCSSLVGVSGIIIMDTRNTFKIIGQDDIIRTIPKMSSVFVTALDNYEFTIFGKQFCHPPATRATKKIKSRMILDL